MRYAGLKLNDVGNGTGMTVSFWTQGCPHRCKGCHNPETWDFSGGMEYDSSVVDKILEAIPKNGIMRNFSILGGEPLATANLDIVEEVVSAVRHAFPSIHIYLWTGYTLENIMENSRVMSILSKVDTLIDGKFIEEKKNLNLLLRGSSNQRVIDLKTVLNKDGNLTI